MITRAMFVLLLFLSPSLDVYAKDGVGPGCYVVPSSDAESGRIVVCRELYLSLVAQAESGKERYIEVTGYAVLRNGRPYLFASRDLYVYAGGAGGLALHLEPDEIQRFTSMITRLGAVTVAGRYVPGDRWGGEGSIGSLKVIGRHYSLHEVPEGPPALPES